MMQGYFKPEYVQVNGELNHLKPLHVVSLPANLMDISDFANSDLVMGFDHVNGRPLHEHQAKVLKDPMSSMCKILVTNHTEKDMEKYGYEGWDLKATEVCYLSGTGNTS